MTAKELLEKIITEIEKLGIELKTGKLSGAGAYISYKYGFGILDMDRVSVFGACHEYIHVKNKDCIRCSENDWNNPCERKADKEAILYLWQLFEESGGTVEDMTRFIEITECPDKLAKIIILKSKIKEWDKEEVEEQVYLYLDATDEEPQHWNIYRIMDACNIDYKWENLVNRIIAEIYKNFLSSGRI